MPLMEFEQSVQVDIGNTIAVGEHERIFMQQRSQMFDAADGFACRAVALTHGACFLPAVLAHWRRMDTGMAGQTNRNVIDTLKIAGENGFMPMSLNISPSYLATHWEAVCEGAEKAGRTPRRSDWRVRCTLPKPMKRR